MQFLHCSFLVSVRYFWWTLINSSEITIFYLNPGSPELVSRLWLGAPLRSLQGRMWQHKEKASLKNSKKAFGERRVGKNNCDFF